MKRLLPAGMLALASMLLVACAFKGNPYPKTDQTNESWPNYVQRNPNGWVNGASRWFLTGDPNVTEQDNMSAPSKAAISTMMVRVPEFTKIKVNGSFQVQIFGAYDHDSVYLYGPNSQVRHVSVEVKGDTLCISAVDGDSSKLCNVIVRVGVVNLNKLSQMGCGRIEGRQLRSTGLEIESFGSGNMYLAGDMRLHRVTQNGDGNINIFGAHTPMLDITTAKKGGVNVSGNLGLRSIKHQGSNDINIIGANGGGVKIYTEGSGKIGINGAVNIREITAKGNTCVYSYCVRSDSLYVYGSDSAKVGLAGSANNLFVENSNSAQFYGRDLITQSAYVRANGSSHINVTSRDKIYAASTGGSSVYFFGSPNMLSQFTSGNGTVIPIWFDKPNHFPLCATAMTCGGYKDSVPTRKPVRHRRDVNKYVK